MSLKQVPEPRLETKVLYASDFVGDSPHDYRPFVKAIEELNDSGEWESMYSGQLSNGNGYYVFKREYTVHVDATITNMREHLRSTFGDSVDGLTDGTIDDYINDQLTLEQIDEIIEDLEEYYP